MSKKRSGYWNEREYLIEKWYSVMPNLYLMNYFEGRISSLEMMNNRKKRKNDFLRHTKV